MKKLIFSLITLFTLSLSAQIDRIEPPFWYEGMSKSEVQVLFYGKNIRSELRYKVSNNVVITNVSQNRKSKIILFVTIDTKKCKKHKNCNLRLPMVKNQFKRNFEI